MRCFFLLLCLLEGYTCASQDSLEIKGDACSYYGEALGEKVVMSADEGEARQIISSIIEVIGLKPRFEIRAADIPNAAAVIHNNDRYVLYNPRFITSLNERAGNKWASVSILAHEIGHHLNGHTLLSGGSRPEIELEADEFSGFVLSRMGATLDEAQGAMRIAASIKASHTHPARAQRMEAIARGWKNAGGLQPRPREQELKKPIVEENPREEMAVLADKYISADVSFAADRTGRYFITIRNNLVKVEGDKLFIIGRLAESNKKGYPYMLYDEYFNYMYVTRNGVIHNGAGRAVGKIKIREIKK